MQVRNPLVRVHHRQGRTLPITGRNIRLDLLLRRLRKFPDLGVQIAQAVVGIETARRKRRRMFFENLVKEDRHDMAKHDRIGNLHHGRLEVQRKEHPLRLGVFDLLRDELAQRPAAHHRDVNHLARRQGGFLLEDSRLPIRADPLDPDVHGVGHRQRLLRAVEIAVVHMRNVRFGVGTPRTHFVRILFCVVFDRGRRPAVGVALAQHGVDRATQHLAVAGLDLLFGVVLRGLRIVRNGVSLRLEFPDGRLQLRDGRADVRQFDDIGIRVFGPLAQLGQMVRYPSIRA